MGSLLFERAYVLEREAQYYIYPGRRAAYVHCTEPAAENNRAFGKPIPAKIWRPR